MARLVVSATYASEKSPDTNATASTNVARAAKTEEPMSAQRLPVTTARNAQPMAAQTATGPISPALTIEIVPAGPPLSGRAPHRDSHHASTMASISPRAVSTSATSSNSMYRGVTAPLQPRVLTGDGGARVEHETHL